MRLYEINKEVKEVSKMIDWLMSDKLGMFWYNNKDPFSLLDEESRKRYDDMEKAKENLENMREELLQQYIEK